MDNTRFNRARVVLGLVFLFTVGAASAALRPRQVIDSGDPKTIHITASRFRFEPATISVVEGDKVQLRVRSADQTHGFAIKAFRVKAPISKSGEEVIVEFVADKAGTFDITCSEYCGSGHSAMKGKLVVLAKEK
jgi:cytochrome c oxidase subunit II